ncbi:MAG: CRISPR-associated protein Cas7 [Lewinellaceae bacterium]|nr:CRISPR-associated protein Cas7 [Lewinellaceae bacterium]
MDTIYIRTLKRAEHTVFCVQDGQKTYYDPQFGRRVPYSSGQQVKRSLLDALNNTLKTQGSPTTFLWDVTKKGELKEGEVFSTCNPTYADQLFGGWMKAAKGGKEKTLKRRSPLSISAMRALHPLLAGTDTENITFDRSDRPNNEIIVRDEKGNPLNEEDIQALLEGKDRSLRRKWIPDNRRATGLFVQDIAIDLRRLFSVTLNPYEPEIAPEVEMSLREAGWVLGENVFGPCLTAPSDIRVKWIPAIASAIVSWKITSNQARTFSLMETLALAASSNANKIASCIRAKLTEDEKAKPVIEEALEGVETFVTLPAAGYLITTSESADALEQAKNHLIEQLHAFNYENQLKEI